MKRTAISAKSFAIAMLQAVLLILLTIGTIGASIITFESLGGLWGTFSIAFYAVVALWFYVHNMRGVRTKIQDHIDAFLATLGSFAGTVVVVFVGMLFGSWVSATTNQTYGWLSFAGSIGLMFILYLFSHHAMHEEEYN